MFNRRINTTKTFLARQALCFEKSSDGSDCFALGSKLQLASVRSAEHVTSKAFLASKLGFWFSHQNPPPSRVYSLTQQGWRLISLIIAKIFIAKWTSLPSQRDICTMCFVVELLSQVSRCNNNVNALSGPSNNKLDWSPLVGRILSYHAHYFEF